MMSATASLLDVFSRLDDPRKARGVRYPFASIVSLTLLGMLARIREMEVLVRWATVHWDSLHMLNAFVHDVQAVIGQWSTGDDKTNEPALFRRQLRGLLVSYPMLQLITGDAIFAQRPLIKMIRNLGKDYLFQIKDNQGDTLDALENCFAKATERPPTATMDEKRELCGSTVVYGWI